MEAKWTTGQIFHQKGWLIQKTGNGQRNDGTQGHQYFETKVSSNNPFSAIHFVCHMNGDSTEEMMH